VFHKTVFQKGAYSAVENDIPAIAITAVLTAMDTFPQDKLYQIVSSVFSSTAELSAVWKDAPSSFLAVGEPSGPDAIQYLRRVTEIFKEKGA
jgi:TRAP-type uncharacterized transport system substrate-binding protein